MNCKRTIEYLLKLKKNQVNEFETVFRCYFCWSNVDSEDFNLNGMQTNRIVKISFVVFKLNPFGWRRSEPTTNVQNEKIFSFQYMFFFNQSST